MILIIDYGVGNLLSVAKAFEEVSPGAEVVVTNRPAKLKDASHIVLPGVGNFKTGIDNLQRLGFVGPLEEEVIANRKPFLGICLGLQLLAEWGEEGGKHRGLGWIPGTVRRLDSKGSPLPHIGWQDIEIAKECPLFSNGAGTRDFYFVHSFILDCPGEYVLSHCTYGERFPAAVQRENIYATQFHPEKSRVGGLDVLRGFLRKDECSRSEWFLSSF